jgi:hypothetical protein
MGRTRTGELAVRGIGLIPEFAFIRRRGGEREGRGGLWRGGGGGGSGKSTVRSQSMGRNTVDNSIILIIRALLPRVHEYTVWLPRADRSSQHPQVRSAQEHRHFGNESCGGSGGTELHVYRAAYRRFDSTLSVSIHTTQGSHRCNMYSHQCPSLRRSASRTRSRISAKAVLNG